MGEAGIDHLRVPAPIFIFVNGNRLSQANRESNYMISGFSAIQDYPGV
jgi:hypothetical protein